MRPDELCSLVGLGRRTKVDSSTRRIMHLLPVFILQEINGRRSNVCPSSSQTDYASFMVRPVFTLDG